MTCFSPSPQATRGMDIFDTFFLVEYLRQWAARGRIVFMTLQPPTYEILTMISKASCSHGMRRTSHYND